MATRLWIHSTETPPVSPAFDASWEDTGGAVRRNLVVEKVDDLSDLVSVARAIASNTPAGAVDVLLVQAVSAPLNGAQNLAGAIKAIFRAMESNAAADMRSQMTVRVVSNDGSTFRAGGLAHDTGALASEWNTSLRNIKFPKAYAGSGGTPTTANGQDGDRLVVELGFRKHESATTSRTGTVNIGSPLFDPATGIAYSDLTENETGTTAGTGWVEFVDTFAFNVTAHRVTATRATIATQPTGATRVTALRGVVATQPTGATRVSGLRAVIAIQSPVPAGGGAGARFYATIIG